MSKLESQNLQQIGCFKVGSKVVRGNGRKVLTVTALRSQQHGRALAKLNAGAWYDLRDILLAGPNGDGEGA
jgi:hypothetical protein